jgi:hypothetical protein
MLLIIERRLINTDDRHADNSFTHNTNKAIERSRINQYARIEKPPGISALFTALSTEAKSSGRSWPYQRP